jgi:hypothetical protein
MTSTTLDPRHPILACVTEIATAVKDVADVQPCFMRTAEKAEALLGLVAVENQLAELKARLLAAADDVAEAAGDRDPAVWLSGHANTDTRATRAEWHLAKELDRNHSAVTAGMRDGAVSPVQARVIVDAITHLPGDLDPDLLASAETHLVSQAAHFRPSQLRRLGRRLLEVIAPEIAEAEEAKALAAMEQRARDTMRLSLHPRGDGTTRITGLLPDETAARLKTYLEAYTNPRQASTTGLETSTGYSSDRRPQRQQYAHAFAALLEHLDPHQLPEHGGDATTVMVTLSLDQLRTDLATAGLLDADLAHGPNLTAETARRLACTANIIPVVLNGQSEILDFGRARRLHSKPQRKAIRLRDKRCRAEGCTIPAPWTEAHHLKPWSQGGTTDIATAISLCNYHHHRIHDHRYETEHLPSGDIRFRRVVASGARVP